MFILEYYNLCHTPPDAEVLPSLPRRKPVIASPDSPKPAKLNFGNFGANFKFGTQETVNHPRDNVYMINQLLPNSQMSSISSQQYMSTTSQQSTLFRTGSEMKTCSDLRTGSDLKTGSEFRTGSEMRSSTRCGSRTSAASTNLSSRTSHYR